MRCKQQNNTLYFAKPVLFWNTGGSYNGSIISKTNPLMTTLIAAALFLRPNVF